MLTEQNPKHWAPITAITEWLCRQIPEGAKVLEIGPGYVPFPRAQTFVDIRELPGVETIKCDLNDEPLPFADKEFDLIYCRHVLEDMYNPFLLCREMSRVGKAGYIETPSPLCEFCRGVDGGSPAWRGYHHHRFIVWPKGDELQFVSKFPLIEHVAGDEREAKLAEPAAWNSFFLWKNELKFRHIQCPQDFMLPGDYPAILQQATQEYLTSLQDFSQTIQGNWSIN